MSQQQPGNGENNAETSKPTKRKRRSPIGFSQFAAVVFCLLIGAWMLSGEIITGGSDEDKIPPILEQQNSASTSNGQQAAKLFRVRAQLFKSRKRQEILKLRARTEAEASVEIRAETTGRVLAVGGEKGQLVNKGDSLCRLDEGSRKATLAGARAQVAQTRSDYSASRKLAKRGFSADLNVSAKRAAYEAAVAALEQAELDLGNTSIKAPFAGIIQTQPAKVGDYLTAGAICARLVKLHPLLVVGDISERDIGKLRKGQKGKAHLVTGEQVEGRLRFISSSADSSTRTFRIELQVDNRARTMRDGVTADIFLPLAPTNGHFISPALLTLNDAGEVGVRTVDKDGVVQFRPVRILAQNKDGAWVSGLDEEVTIIVAGQDFVIHGQKVEVVMVDPEAEKAKTANEGATSDERS